MKTDDVSVFINDIQISDSRKIVDTRNRSIHGYDSVSPDIIWLIVKKYIVFVRKRINN